MELLHSLPSSSHVALVSTVWLADVSPRHTGVLSAFLLYHAALGVAKSFVFLDGDRSSQPRIDHLHADVQALHVAGRVELRYHHDEDGASALKGDVVTRQMRNAAQAMRLCLEHNRRVPASEELRWLLHLDIDELLYLEALGGAFQCSPRAALDAFVKTLETPQPPTLQLTLANYEAIPTTLHGGVYFQNTTIFRRHHAHVPFTHTAQDALAFWRQRTVNDQFFLFYDNGKAVVRVQAGVEPASVHHWRQRRSSSDAHAAMTTTAAVSRANFFDARRNLAPNDVVVETVEHRACVLHYPVCGLEWLIEKYERLGPFPSVWGGDADGAQALQILPCFHTQARDAVTGASEGDKLSAVGEEKTGRDAAIATALEELYRSHVLLDLEDAASASEWQRQVAAGVCEQIQFPSKLLAKYRFDTSLRGFAQPITTVQMGSATLPSAPHVSATAAASPAFTAEKAWMLAAISQQYLQNQ